MTKDINLEDHFGKPLPEDLQPQHEIRARQFIDQAGEQMSLLYPNVSFFVNFSTGSEIFKGGEAQRGLRMWDSSEMDKYRDPDLKKFLEEEVKIGNKADIESAFMSKVRCNMIGDQQEKLRQALKMISLLAADKGGSLDNSKEGKNILHGLAKHPGAQNVEGLEELVKEFSLESYFSFT